MYVRFPGDDVFGVWKASELNKTDLIAHRFGYGSLLPQDRPCVQAKSEGHAPGMRIEFNPVPEPGSWSLAGLALVAAAVVHRSRRGPTPEPIDSVATRARRHVGVTAPNGGQCALR